jgi:hypothetical protein
VDGKVVGDFRRQAEQTFENAIAIHTNQHMPAESWKVAKPFRACEARHDRTPAILFLDDSRIAERRSFRRKQI